MPAHAYLAVLRETVVWGEPDPGLAAELLPLAAPELRRLLWHLVFPQRPASEGILARSQRRRRHQQRARRSHRRRRASSETRM
jgi:hypothetical protein